MAFSQTIMAILVTAAVGSGAAVAREVTCPENFHVIADKCFQFVIGSQSWATSEENCEGMGGHLAILSDCSVLKEVVRYIYAQGLQDYNFYIGAHDISETGNWLWVDGEVVEMGMPYWGSSGGEPEPGSEDYFAFLSNADRHYFHGGPTTATASAICQVSPVAVTEPKLEAPSDDET